MLWWWHYVAAILAKLSASCYLYTAQTFLANSLRLQAKFDPMTLGLEIQSPKELYLLSYLANYLIWFHEIVSSRR